MCSPQGIIEQLGGLAFGEAVKAGKYVLHYEKNLGKLQDELKDLDARRGSIEIKVHKANDDGEEIMPDVKRWQTKAEDMKTDVDQLIHQSTVKGNMHCIACSCPNIKWRYRLSKQAEQKILDVKELTEKGHFDEISHPRPPPLELKFPYDENFVNMDSRKPIFDNIVDALKDSSVNTIGVHGPGGVGKTTLVKEVGQKMGHDGYFKQVLLATIPKGQKVEEIQSQLIDGLNLKFDLTKGSRKVQLLSILSKGDKYLVILDDIWEKVDLKDIGIPITNEKKSCKVLLTSRKRDLLLNTMEVQKNFGILELPEAEAWDLFKKKVGNSFESRPELNAIGHKVCNKCKGLPVAINAIGEALKYKPDFAWKDALVKLESYGLMKIEGIDSSVGASLRLSYDLLGSSNAKSCFLLCCLFPEDAEIPIGDLTRQCLARRLLFPNPRTVEEARNSVCTVIDALKSASLLSNGSHENVVRIHDVIRDVGISIGREENAFFVEQGTLHWPEDGPLYSAISLTSGKIQALPTELTCPKLHTLMFENSELSNLEVPDEFFSGMTQLSVLILTRMRMQQLPSSLGKLAKLRMLYLIECHLTDIAILGDLNKNLEVLSLRGSSIQALPPKIGKLTRLRVLDLEECDELQVIPQGIVSKLTDLEELYFPNTFYEWEATTDKKQDASSSNNVNLEELRLPLTRGKLTVLHIFIPDVELLPKEGLKFENLKRFRVSVGSNFEYDEDFSAATRALKYEGISLRNEFIPLVDNAEMLYLGIEGLKKVLHDSGVRKGFLDLKHLKVTSCDDDLEYLLGEPKSSVQSHGQNPLQSFNKLTVLLIETCKLKYLFSPTTVKGLVHLEQLEVSSCHIMEGIVGFEEQNDVNEHVGEVKFDKLKRLELKNLRNLISFYVKKEKTRTTMGSSFAHPLPLFDEKVAFPALEYLNIFDVPNITEIWDKKTLPKSEKETQSFWRLRDIGIRYCDQLVYVLPCYMLPQLQINLQSLRIWECEKVEVIVSKELKEKEATDNEVIVFHQLKDVAFCRLRKLKGFHTGTELLFSHKVIFPLLEVLELQNLDNITEIWDKQSIAVLEEQGSFCQLMEVNVNNCVQLTHVFPSKMHALLKNLKELQVECCTSMKGIVKFEGDIDEDGLKNELCFSKLSTLRLDYLRNLESFCTELRTASTTNGNATILAQPLFNEKVIFPLLEVLELQNLDNITEIWDKQSIAVLEEQGSFCQLMEVNVNNCVQLTHVFPSKMHALLKNLKELQVECCTSMKGIVKFEGDIDEDGLKNELCFSKLSTLRLDYLRNLESFCTELRTASTTNGNATILAQPLFNEKVAFPALEVLTIFDVPNITEIWDKKPLPESEKETQSFWRLRDIHISYCDQLVYVLPCYMLPQLKINLQSLRIEKCKEVEVIVLKEKEGTENEVIVFHQLQKVWFQDLHKLKSFYIGTELLFSPKVAFPALEYLHISHVPNITEIWDKKPLPESEKETQSFSRIRDIVICECNQLVYVLPFYMLPQLQINLRSLKIEKCEEVEVIVLKELKEKEATDNEIIVFHQLKKASILDLPKLKSFYTGTELLFSHKVIFPLLEVLELQNLDNITEIWDKQSIAVLEEQGSFCQLMEVNVSNCVQLTHVFSSKMHALLKNLKELQVERCTSMKGIVKFEGDIYEDGLKNELCFSKLSTLRLDYLRNLESFCTELRTTSTTNGNATILAQPLFNEKVAFPSLEYLFIVGLPKIKEIWPNKQPHPEPGKEAESFCKLSKIGLWSCNQLVYVFPFYILRQLQHLEELEIQNCEKVEVIVSVELKEEEVIHNDIIVFPQLNAVSIEKLPNIKRICSETQLFFSDEDAFPMLNNIMIDYELEFLRNGTCTKEVSMEECGTSGKENDHNGEED